MVLVFRFAAVVNPSIQSFPSLTHLFFSSSLCVVLQGKKKKKTKRIKILSTGNEKRQEENKTQPHLSPHHRVNECVLLEEPEELEEEEEAVVVEKNRPPTYTSRNPLQLSLSNVPPERKKETRSHRLRRCCFCVAVEVQQRVLDSLSSSTATRTRGR